MLTIQSYLPDADIVGCDVNIAPALERGGLPGEVFVSTPDTVLEHGPYDIIMANSVLCYYPLPKGGKHADLFPFSEFVELSSVLHNALKDGGLLCLFNTSYFFEDLPFFSEYRTVGSPLTAMNGFLPKFRKDGTQVTNYYSKKSEGGARIEIIRPDLIPPGAMSSALFQKTAGEPLWLEAADLAAMA